MPERLENDVYVGMDVGVLLETEEFRGGGKTGTFISARLDFSPEKMEKIDVSVAVQRRPAHRAAGVGVFTGGHKEKNG